MNNSAKKLNLTELIGLVIGSIIGGGIFNLMHDMASQAGVGAVIIGWIITAIGMLSLAFTFQNLTNKRPDLQAGIYSFADAGFGHYIGFNSAWGYWLSVWLGNISYAILLMSALTYFFPIFDNGHNLVSFIASSIILWGGHYLVSRGIHSASFINTIITITKLIPILLFILIVFLSFKLNVFTSDFWLTGNKPFNFSDVLSQVKSTMLVTVFVFSGIEGAVIFSGYAKKRKDIGRATILGIITVTLIYMLITLLSFGVMHQAQLASLGQPAMADLLQHLVGKWGAVVVNVGLIIAVLGAWLSWTMFAAEVPYEAAKVGSFPKIFAKENKNGTPINSLIFTNVLVELFMISFFVASSAYNLFLSISSAAVLIPYAFSAFYQVKYSYLNKDLNDRKRNIFLGIVSSIYACWLLYAAGLNYILMTTILFALGIPVYYYLQKYDNKNKHVFTKIEAVIAFILLILAILAIYEIATGKITF
ncbi:arginine-ornithine antiporter [Apilactobacillus apinorum]|uniref:Arginine-ornithine antiporter n=1 Tax=Apilactobacillus apinorum TaxID=1218495 RepID=A0ABP9ZGW7_9LACO|nr:arginine-ornithine antiporter [Apilactobacillus apinorum]KOY69049.1 APC family amino acid-polyamine-organocation transporter [Apilactobacillus apinorum]CAI2681134.1 APC family amino acid-polyamine-organocation transporter [Apilactobacillus apinorum]